MLLLCKSKWGTHCMLHMWSPFSSELCVLYVDVRHHEWGQESGDAELCGLYLKPSEYKVTCPLRSHHCLQLPAPARVTFCSNFIKHMSDSAPQTPFGFRLRTGYYAAGNIRFTTLSLFCFAFWTKTFHLLCLCVWGFQRSDFIPVKHLHCEF